MKKKFCPMILTALLLTAPALASDEEDEWGEDLEQDIWEEQVDSASKLVFNTTYVSRHLWRGFDLNGGRPVLLPSVRLETPAGFSLDVSGSIGVGRRQLDEVDVGLQYQREIIPERLELSVGVHTYQYLGTEGGVYLTGSTEYANGFEALVGFTSQNLPLQLAVEYGRGLGGIEGGGAQGNYTGFSVGREVRLGNWAFNSGVSATYLDQYEVSNKITEISFKNELALTAGHFILQPTVTFAYLPAPELTNGNDEDKIVWWGMAVFYSW